MKNFKNCAVLAFSFTSCRRVSGMLLLLSAFTFSGCLSRPAVKEKTFAFSIPSSSVMSEATGGRVLGLRTLQVAPPFDGRSFVYRTGEFSYERDPYAGFLGLPTEVLVGPITELLREDGCFNAVVRMGSADRPDTLIEINVTELYGDFRKADSPAAVLAIQVVLTDAKNGLSGKVLLQKNYSRRIPMKSTAPAALMAAWNEALVEIFADIASDFQRQESKPAYSLSK
jgi:cholesterol transport system auxiliary component